MNIQKIKAALTKQAQLLGVVPVAMNTTAKSTQVEDETNKSAAHSSTVTADNTLRSPAVVTQKETVQASPTIVAASADSVSIVSKTAPVTISSDNDMSNPSLFDTIASPTVSPNISKIPAERQEPVNISSSLQTPTLPAADSVQPPVSIADSNQLSLQPVLIPDETKPARKRKKVESPVVIVEPKEEPIERIVAKHLRAGRDYDRLPNTSKPTLFKSGAEILCGVFGFRTTTSVINRVIDFEKSFVMYEAQITVYDKDDKIVAEGIGSCNSKERKYLRGDFCTQLNTILKMAKKRAYVDAMLTACHASKVFTQDVEDIAAGVADEVSTKKGA